MYRAIACIHTLLHWNHTTHMHKAFHQNSHGTLQCDGLTSPSAHGMKTNVYIVIACTHTPLHCDHTTHMHKAFHQNSHGTLQCDGLTSPSAHGMKTNVYLIVACIHTLLHRGRTTHMHTPEQSRNAPMGWSNVSECTRNEDKRVHSHSLHTAVAVLLIVVVNFCKSVGFKPQICTFRCCHQLIPVRQILKSLSVVVPMQLCMYAGCDFEQICLHSACTWRR